MRKENIEELLKPRYKVIADYPGCKFNIGDIVTFVRSVNKYELWVSQDGQLITFNSFSKYPHLFNKLEWWEERSLEQLNAVEYVKIIRYEHYWQVGDIVPVERFVYEKGRPMGYDLKYNKHHPVYSIMPATITEYEAYINQQKQNNADRART